MPCCGPGMACSLLPRGCNSVLGPLRKAPSPPTALRSAAPLHTETLPLTTSAGPRLAASPAASSAASAAFGSVSSELLRGCRAAGRVIEG